MKSSLEGNTNRLEFVENRTSALEDRVYDLEYIEFNREKKKNHRT